MSFDDIFALADAFGLESFALVGHDWGGAIAWPAALRGDPRLEQARHRQRAASPGLPEEPDRETRRSAPPRNISTGSGRRERSRRSRRWDSMHFSRRPSSATSSSPADLGAEKQRLCIAEWSKPGANDRDAQLVPRQQADRAAAGRNGPVARIPAPARSRRSPFRRWSSGA